MGDLVKSPNHYVKMAAVVEPIEVTYAMHSCLGQALQYILRYQLKDNPAQDLKKAKFGLEWFCKRYFTGPFGSCQAVNVLATDSKTDEAMRIAFVSTFKTDDPIIAVAVRVLLEAGYVDADSVNQLIARLSLRIHQLENA